MSRIVWDQERPYEAGVDRGVLYSDGLGVAWNGLVSVEETTDNAEEGILYFDGDRYLIAHTSKNFSAVISAFTYPDTLQENVPFDFSYREEKVGGHKIHLVYNATAKFSTRAWNTIADQPEPSTFTWDISTTPRIIPESMPSAHLIVDTTTTSEAVIENFESLIYGTDSTLSHLPDPANVIEIFENAATLLIQLNGDGTWTAFGPDDVIIFTDPTTFEITWPSVVYVNGMNSSESDTYNISTL